MYKLSPKGRKQGGVLPASSLNFILCVGVLTTFILAGVTQATSAPHSTNQTTLDKIEVTVELNRESLKALFKKIESQTELKFVFFENQISAFNNFNLSKATRSVRDVLEITLAGTGLSYIQSDNTVYIRKGSNHVGKNSGGTSFVEKVPMAAVPSSPATPQYFTVTGKITDASDGQPMPGVSIFVKGSTNGTTSDAQGTFTMSVNTDDYLVFSSIGYRTMEMAVGGRALIEVSMEEDVATLEAVTVNAGYYQVSDLERTGSISKVSGDVIGKQPVTNAMATIAGRMPGVYVQQTTGVPGGDFRIQIRGQNSLRVDGNDPLYIVDGVPFSTDKVSSDGVTSGTFNGPAASPLTGINTSDIESIEVLKDADATAIYGSRGANGVVLITTKKGRSGKTKVDVNAYYGAGWTAKVKLANTPQYLALRKKAFAQDGVMPNPTNAPDLMVWDTTRYTDWQKLFFGNPSTTASVQASLSGGSDITQFIISGGYRKETSAYPGDFKYQKGSIHISVNHLSDNKKLSVGSSFSGTIDGNNQPAFDPVAGAKYLPPVAPSLYNGDGTLNWDKIDWPTGNPMASFFQTYSNGVSTVIVSTDLGYEILPGLKLKNRSGFTSLQSKEFLAIPSTIYNPADKKTSKDALARTSVGSNQSWIIEPQISWNKTFGRGNLSLLVGGTFQGQALELTAMEYSRFTSNALLHDVRTALSVNGVGYTSTKYKYNAVFGRLNYNWNGKYLLNFTGRRDGSSRFGPGKQFANFGAVGMAWIFCNEQFVKENIRFLSFGKLRGSYGITGSDRIGDYKYLDTYSGTANQYQGIKGLSPSRLFNPDYAWEANKKLEAAIEVGFLNDLVFFTAAYFKNRSTNQLVDYALPMTAGYQYVTANLPATVDNTGIELELKTVNIDTRVINWKTSLNLTVPRNRLVAFPNLESSTYANRYVIGQPLSVQRRFKYTGVNSQTGLYTFKDFNEDGVISLTDDQKEFVFVGQKFFGGLNNSLTWKGFTMDIFFQFVKQAGLNYSRSVYPGFMASVPAFVLGEKIWEKPGDVATIQKLTAVGNQEVTDAFYFFGQSDATISDASFVRLKNFSLCYTITELAKRMNCRVYIQAQNLFVITRYRSFDPESQYQSLAPLRLFTTGIQITL